MGYGVMFPCKQTRLFKAILFPTALEQLDCGHMQKFPY